MQLYPAIDLSGGRVVRLTQGDFARATVYEEDPARAARSFFDKGATWLHVVDLDGAKTGQPGNLRALEAIIGSFRGKIQVGGGIRTLDTARRILDLGVERLVLGTGALTNPDFLAAMLRECPGRFFVGVDVRDGKMAISGWLETTGGAPGETMKRLASDGVAGFVYTDIARDGMLEGPNLPVYRELAETLSVPVIASGGIGSLDDILRLREAKVSGAIVGRALYTGAVDLSQALALCRPDPAPC